MILALVLTSFIITLVLVHGLFMSVAVVHDPFIALLHHSFQVPSKSGSGTWPIHCIAAPFTPSAIKAPATSPPLACPHAATICNAEVTVHL
jgi:hypothetical protein